MKLDHDVTIIGAGLAGLSCARVLNEKGVSFLLLEASDGLGGRVRTDKVDGFLLDRGFQVLLTAYPEVRRILDMDALKLKPFYPGTLIRAGGRFERLVDPWRRPVDGLRTLIGSHLSLADRLAIARLRRRACRGSLEELWTRAESTTMDVLKEAGLSDLAIETFFRPYLGGIFLEPRLETSSRMFDFVFRMMASGDVSLPAGGMGSITEQLAARLPRESVRTRAPVASIGDGHVKLESGEVLSSRSIVVATDGVTSRRFLPELSPSGWRGVTCIYFAADKPPLDEPILVLNGEGGPVNNLAVLSNIAPSYAPSGAALVSVTVLGVGHPAEEEEQLQAVRDQLASWYGQEPRDWTHLRTYRLGRALPAQNPPALSTPERPSRVRPGVYICGDHRDNASIQGAMVSGGRAAEALMKDVNLAAA